LDILDFRLQIFLPWRASLRAANPKSKIQNRTLRAANPKSNVAGSAKIKNPELK
jgi:hypothetical protein